MIARNTRKEGICHGYRKNNGSTKEEIAAYRVFAVSLHLAGYVYPYVYGGILHFYPAAGVVFLSALLGRAFLGENGGTDLLYDFRRSSFGTGGTDFHHFQETHLALSSGDFCFLSDQLCMVLS